jgi:hypothetical protein
LRRYWIICCAMYSCRQEFSLRCGLRVDDKGMMKILGVSRTIYHLFNLYVSCLFVWVLLSCISQKITLIIGNSENKSHFIKFYNVYPEKGDVVLCQTCEVVCGELKCVGFFALSICGVMLWVSFGLWNLFVLKGLYHKCNLGLGFFLKFHVVLGCMWFEIIDKS